MPAQARRGGVLDRGVGAHPDEEHRRHGDADDVDEEAPAGADRVQQHAADRGARPASRSGSRPSDRATAAGSCSWSTVRGISASRDGRCSDCAAESSAATTKITQICGSGRNALTTSRLVKTDLRDAGPHQEGPPVHVVGQRAAPETEDDERDELDHADRADDEVRPGQVVELERHGDVGDHPAEVEDRAGEEQQPVVARLPVRGDVHPDPVQRGQPGHVGSVPAPLRGRQRVFSSPGRSSARGGGLAQRPHHDVVAVVGRAVRSATTQLIATTVSGRTRTTSSVEVSRRRGPTARSSRRRRRRRGWS